MIGAKILPYKKKSFMNHKTGNLYLKSSLVKNHNSKKDHCVVDYIWSEIKGKMGFRAYTYNILRDELARFSEEPPKMCIKEMLNWSRECHPNISIHCFDATYRNCRTLKPVGTSSRVYLVFYIK